MAILVRAFIRTDAIVISVPLNVAVMIRVITVMVFPVLIFRVATALGQFEPTVPFSQTGGTAMNPKGRMLDLVKANIGIIGLDMDRQQGNDRCDGMVGGSKLHGFENEVLS